MAYDVIQNGEVIGTSDTIVHIFFGKNEAYQECTEDIADGFCVKLPKVFQLEDGTQEIENVDTVFVLPGHTLRGGEPEAEFKEAGKSKDLTKTTAADNRKTLQVVDGV